MHSNTTDAPDSAPRVLYIGTDGGLTQRIRPLLEKQGVELLTATDPADPSATQPAPQVIALDTGVLRPGQTVKDLAASLPVTGARPPSLVVIARSKDIGLRLQALRANAAAYYVAPVASSELSEKLLELSRPRPRISARVLIVEDSAVQSILAERVLKAAGFSVRILTDSLKILEVLEEVEPDLILMDLHMPGASGDELAAIIREQEGFQLVPIVFLSNERDPQRQVDALSMGGDAFITKPVAPDILVRVVTQRIEIMRALRARVDLVDHRDPDTGLATRSHFLSCLERALAEPGIEQPGNGLLLVALDGASLIEEQIGGAGSDLVRDRIGVMIRGQLGPADLAARLDQQFHAVLVRRPDADALRQFAEDLRRLIAGYPIAMSGKTVAATVSLGIAPFNLVAADALTVISRARRACSDARRGNGNRTVIFGTSAQGLAEDVHDRHLTDLIGRALSDPAGGLGFQVLYQPLVAVNVEQRQYVEVSLGLVERDGTALASRDFMPVAERAGRVAEIDRWLMLHSLKTLKEHAKAQPGLRLLIPQHLESLSTQGWVMWLRDQLSAHALEERSPILELEFNDLLNHVHVAPMLVKMLHKIGVEVCLTEIDRTPAAQDLATDLRPRFVKLSAATVRHYKVEHFNPLVERLCRGGSQVIACAVDFPEQIGPIWASGVNFAQGALFQAPTAEPVFDWGDAAIG